LGYALLLAWLATAAHAQQPEQASPALERRGWDDVLAAIAELEELGKVTRAVQDRLGKAATAVLEAERARQTASAEAERLRGELKQARQELAEWRAEVERYSAANAELQKMVDSLRADAQSAMEAARRNLVIMDEKIEQLNAALAGAELTDGAPAEARPGNKEGPGARRPPAERRTPTWLRNAVAPAADRGPAIALVIDDLGMNRRATAALNDLPGPLTLSFLPYASKLDEQTGAARAAGHELMVHVPMEPRGSDWPGPDALTSQLAPAELISRLRTNLRSFPGFVGINNHMGSLLTTDPERMAILMAELRQRGLLFLDSRTTPASIAAREAERAGVPYAERDVFIDDDLDLGSVLRELARAESIARYRGHAVAIGHPHDVTIEALKRWLPSLDARGIALVPVSTVVARRSCASGILLVADACARYAVAATVVQ
jgi:polysaccharide deacetylase 2 family uncharacterized protein YibQ